MQGRHTVNPPRTFPSYSDKREHASGSGGAAQTHSPLMELPPLSPGIQARVMEEVDVVETVSRGWSGGTEEELINQ